MSTTELTTAEVAGRLGRPERTVRLWCKQGLFEGAHAVDNPRGAYWLIPVAALDTFVEPKRGAPRKSSPKSNGAAKPARERAAKKGGKE